MTTNIQLLRSSVPYKRPSAAPLLEGQAAVNYNAAEPGLFFRLTDGRLAKVGPVAITDNGIKPNEAPGGETGNSTGETWLNAQPTLHSPVLYVFNGNEFVTANGFTVDTGTGDFTLNRQLNVQRFSTNELQVNGNAIIGGNITPNGQSCAYYLGKPSERWDVAYLCELDVSGNGLISTDLTVGQDASITRDIEIGRHVASNLVPDADVTRTLGFASQRWAQTHTNDLYAYGNTRIGELCSDTLTVTAASTFKCESVFESTLTVQGILSVSTIGNGCSNSLTVDTTSTFKCPVTFENTVTFDQNLSDLILDGAIVLGDGCNTSTINLNGAVTLSCDMLPNADNTRDIGSAANKLKALYATDVYTGDLHLKNEKGDWTMIEAEDYLTIRNNKTGKTFRLLMEEV